MRTLQGSPVGKLVTAAAFVVALGTFATAGLHVAFASPPNAAVSHSTPYTVLTLKNGWTNGPFSTRHAAVMKDANGIAHFKGAIATAGTNPNPFTLPKAFWPGANVYVAVDLCNATNGRLRITKTGVVTVEAESSTFSNAQCFTSLEGVSYGP